MKTLTTLLLFFSINGCINAQPDSLTVKLYDFLISTKDLSEWSKSQNTMLFIIDLVTYKDFENQEYGIFRFSTLTTHTYKHILLVSNGQYSIVNMREPLEKSFRLILEYLKINKNYSKEDIVKYLEKVLDLYKSNSEAIPWRSPR